MQKVTFDPNLAYDDGKGGLRILIPSAEGYINYNFVHSVVPERQCDMWRLSVTNALDTEENHIVQLTKEYAEWEMAIRLDDRPDFIGGFNHGDEVFDQLTLSLDGNPFAPEELTTAHEFDRMEITVTSTGFDPSHPETAVLRHRKHYIFAKDGITLHQTVRWLGDYSLSKTCGSYLAMMPPVKFAGDPTQTITDSYQFSATTPTPIEAFPIECSDTREITVSGRESGYRFTMRVEDYQPLYPNSYYALLTDNGGGNYNKMYFIFAGKSDDSVHTDTLWQSTTHYSIQKSNSSH